MKKNKLTEKIKRYVELSKRFEQEPEVVSSRKRLYMTSLGNSDSLFGCCSSPSSDENSEGKILKRLNDEFDSERNTIQDWFEYLELQKLLEEL